MLSKRLIKSNNAGAGACTNTVDLYNPFPDGGGVALYQLNGDATDVSGNYDGTASNLNYVAGQFGQGASFNTSNSILTTPRAFSTNAPYSVSGWVKIANGSTTQAARLFWQITGTNQTTVQVNYNGVDSYVFGVTHKFETNGGFSHSFAANDGQWHHYAMTFNGSSANLYIDGSFVKSGLLDPKGDVSSTNYIGGTNLYNNITYYDGLDGLDQVRYFNRALRPYEVEALYTEEYCTPTIVPSEHFNTVLYSGNGTGQSINTVGFAPDLVWVKNRFTTNYHILSDTVRGENKQLYSNTADSEQTDAGFITGFNIDGFDIGNSASTNTSGTDNYAAWNFKAGGAAVTNTDGTITSQVSANTEAGFSIVSYTGSVSINQTVGHGLDSKPDMIIVKNRSLANTWAVYNSSLTADYHLVLNTDALAKNNVDWIWNDTEPTDSVFTVGQFGLTNQNPDEFIAYCWHSVEGFSNFGSYVGTGASGNTIVTGFEPAFVMLKRTDSASHWAIADNKRVDGELLANSSDAERNENTPDFLENGFRLTTERYNDSGSKWIYMAFAADPTAVEPTLADSFNTVTYTGQSVPYPVTVGFQPDLIWVKSRTYAYLHGLFDTLRPNGRFLQSNTADAESASNNTAFHTLTDTGFIWTEHSGGFNATGDYVAWNWKGAEIPAINSNGSIPSVVSANPAAGFSIVSYTGTDVNNTIGHGLRIAPNVIIFKDRTIGRNWRVYHSAIGAGQNLKLNTTDAASSDAAIFQSTTPTENVFYVGASGDVNANTDKFIAYCFAEVAGFSKFGSYTGTGSAGNFVSTSVEGDAGFEPAFIMIKRATNGTGGWVMIDSKRSNTGNPINDLLNAQSSDAESVNNTNNNVDFNNNGFTLQGTSNGTNGTNTYIYMAFANQF